MEGLIERERKKRKGKDKLSEERGVRGCVRTQIEDRREHNLLTN